MPFAEGPGQALHVESRLAQIALDRTFGRIGDQQPSFAQDVEYPAENVRCPQFRLRVRSESVEVNQIKGSVKFVILQGSFDLSDAESLGNSRRNVPRSLVQGHEQPVGSVAELRGGSRIDGIGPQGRISHRAVHKESGPRRKPCVQAAAEPDFEQPDMGQAACREPLPYIDVHRFSRRSARRVVRIAENGMPQRGRPVFGRLYDRPDHVRSLNSAESGP